MWLCSYEPGLARSWPPLGISENFIHQPAISSCQLSGVVQERAAEKFELMAAHEAHTSKLRHQVRQLKDDAAAKARQVQEATERMAGEDCC